MVGGMGFCQMGTSKAGSDIRWMGFCERES